MDIVNVGHAGAAAGKPGVHIHLLAPAAGLHRALAVRAVPVVRHETVVVGGQQTVLLVPLQLALMGFLVRPSVLLHASGVDVDKVPFASYS